MKSLGLFLCSALVLSTMSCTKELVTLPSDSGREEVELTITVGTGQTRADEASVDENKVESLQIFIFSNDRLEAVCYSLSNFVTTRCFEGYKNIYAIVNHSEIEWASGITEEKLLETVFVLTGEEGWNTMVGSETDIYISAVSDKSPVRVWMDVKRVAARIVLRTVRNLLDDTVTVTRAYITNVVGDTDFYAVQSSDYSHKPDIWYNKMGNTGDLDDILCSKEMAKDISRRMFQNFDECFYCYPNPTKEDYKFGDWCPRFTRLVVEAEYAECFWYYVVPLGGVQEDYSFIQSNHSYEVTLVITDLGAVDAEGFLDEWVDDNVEKSPVSTKSGDGTAVVRFAGGCAEVKEL